MVLQSLARGFEINGNVYTWLCVGLGLHYRKADSYGANQYQHQSAFVQIARRIVQIGGLIYLTNPEHKLVILQIRDTIVLGIGKLPIRLPDWLGKLTPRFG